MDLIGSIKFAELLSLYSAQVVAQLLHLQRVLGFHCRLNALHRFRKIDESQDSRQIRHSVVKGVQLAEDGKQ